MRVVVCGSRGWTNESVMRGRLDQLPDKSLLIVGGATGADQMADAYARERGLHSAIVYPRWDHFGNGAGPERNRAMLSLDPDLVLAFSLGTSGTQNTIDEARECGIPVEVIGKEIPKAAA